MGRRILLLIRMYLLLMGTSFLISQAWSQGVEVSVNVRVIRMQGQRRLPDSAANIVVWLTPAHGSLLPSLTVDRRKYTLTQKNKQFSPHLLVVPTGSSVHFPNLDPYFHNVFSLFNGKRFDLGLYEPQTDRTVLFDREGISYIFCNIHPEMGAVVVTLNTPYYGVSSQGGTIVIHNVRPGSYRLSVWAENASTETLNSMIHVVQIGAQDIQLGRLDIQANTDATGHHLNKFGEPYPPVAKGPY